MKSTADSSDRRGGVGVSVARPRGAEIGISTSKVHAYGPMGLEELTIQRYVVHGDWQVR